MIRAVPTTAEAPDGPDMLHQHRVTAGLSQNQLARAASIDPAYVNRIERRLGRCTPSRSVVLRLSSALGLDVDQGDRLLHAFGLAGRVDWQAAWARAMADVPVAVARAMAVAMATAVEQAERDPGPEP
jgi:transcriptional regulator with XRE-family HTH domain